MNKKIRDAQLEQVNFILVVGPKDRAARSVTLRDRDDPLKATFMSIEECLKFFRHLNDDHVLPVIKEQPDAFKGKKGKAPKEGKKGKQGKQGKQGKKQAAKE